MSEIQTKIGFQTVSEKGKQTVLAGSQLSECPKTERSVWETEQNLVPLSDILILDNRTDH